MRKLIFTFLIAAGIATANADTITAPVANGHVKTEGPLTTRVHLWGIEMPGSRQLCRDKLGNCYPCGEVAVSRLHGMLGDHVAKCKLASDETKNGRVVATCTVDGVDLALQMLMEGMAVADEHALNTNPEMKLGYLDAQQSAKSEERGIWQGEFVLPSEWRKENKRLSGCELKHK